MNKIMKYFSVLIVTFFINMNCNLYLYAEEENNANKNNFLFDISPTTQKAKVFFLQEKNTDIVRINITFKFAGSSYMPQQKIALPDLYTHSIYSSMEKYTKLEFIKKCEQYSCSISHEADKDVLQINCKVPKIVYKEALELLKDILASSNFEKCEITNDKSKLIEIENFQKYNPVKILHNHIFENHVYANHRYGAINNIMNLNVFDLKNYKKKYITQENINIMILGNITKSEATNITNSILNILPKKFQETNLVPKVTIKNSKKIKYIYAPNKQSTIVFALPNKMQKSPDRAAASILYNILGGPNFQSKMMSSLRTDNGLVYGAYVTLYDLDNISYIVGMIQTDNGNVEKAINTMQKLISDLKNNGISQQDLDFFKSNLSGRFTVHCATFDNLCQYYSDMMCRGFDINILAIAQKNIENVSLETINKVAKELFSDENILYIVVGEKKDEK